MDRRTFTSWILKAVTAAAAGPKDIIPAVEALAQTAPAAVAKPASLVFKLAGSMQMSLDVSSIRSLYDEKNPRDFGASSLGKGLFAKIHAITDPQARATAIGKQTVAILHSMVNAMGETSNAFNDDTVAAILDQGALNPTAAAIKSAIEKDLAALPAEGIISRRSVGTMLKEMATRRRAGGVLTSIPQSQVDEVVKQFSPPDEFCMEDVCEQIKKELETVAKDGFKKHGVSIEESPPIEELQHQEPEPKKESITKLDEASKEAGTGLHNDLSSQYTSRLEDLLLEGEWAQKERERKATASENSVKK